MLFNWLIPGHTDADVAPGDSVTLIVHPSLSGENEVIIMVSERSAMQLERKHRHTVSKHIEIFSCVFFCCSGFVVFIILHTNMIYFHVCIVLLLIRLYFYVTIFQVIIHSCNWMIFIYIFIHADPGNYNILNVHWSYLWQSYRDLGLMQLP